MHSILEELAKLVGRAWARQWLENQIAIGPVSSENANSETPNEDPAAARRSQLPQEDRNKGTT